MRDFPTDAEILKVFESRPQREFRLREVMDALQLRSSEARELKRTLRGMVRARQLSAEKRGGLRLAARLRPATAETPELGPRTGRASTGPTATAKKQSAGVFGRLIAHRDGYGFVVPDDSRIGADIFIPPIGIGSAMHGDKVLVHVVEKRAQPAPRGGRFRPGGEPRRRDEGRRLEGRIIKVVERAHLTVVGEFRYGGRNHWVSPYDRRLPFDIVIARGDEWPPEDAAAGASRHRQRGGESEGMASASRPAHGSSRGDALSLDHMVVDVEITSFPDPVRGIAPRGRVIEILGRREDFGVDVEIMIRKYHLPHRFPPEVLDEASLAPAAVNEADAAGRQDFRGLSIVTIDGETAKDFDDAVNVERLPNGRYRLGVHIADVAHYVRPRSAIDREARLRGTSAYFPDRAVPMLPLELSNGICSLNPQVDRLTMSVLMEVDGNGGVTAYEIVPGVIRSAERMTYTAVHAVLAGDLDALARYAHLAHAFHLMEELALVLNRRRQNRGSIDFDLPAPEVEFDEQGRMVGVTRSERNIAHRIIEEFMLLANETVAGHLERSVATLYRIHEPPDPKKVMEFEAIATAFGHSLGIDLPAAHRQRVHARDQRNRHQRFEEQVERGSVKVTSRDYQRLTERIAGTAEERILSFLMLRSLKQARYSEQNVGHFALAAPVYTHFTSPIRRYPDLIVHRTLKALLAKQGGWAASGHPNAPLEHPARATTSAETATPPGCEGGASATLGELEALGAATSECERRAADAERELMDWKKITFMSEKLGDEFEALVISLTRHGLFVELRDLFIEGWVPIESLDDDRYVYRENLRAIIGLRSRRELRLGDEIQVRLDRIDRVENRLEFALIGTAGKGT